MMNFKKIIQDNLFYIGLILITFILKEAYPFSFYPMYNNFPNWSYTFYFEDESENVLKLPKLTHSSLSHLYYSECQNRNISYGNAIESSKDLKIIGDIMAYNTFNKHFNEPTLVNLHRVFNYLIENTLYSDTLLISSTYVD